MVAGPQFEVSMTPDKADTGAIAALMMGVGSFFAQINNVAAEYLPLVTLCSMLVGAVALAVKVWQVHVQREQARRDRALRHKELEQERALHGRRHDDP